MAAAPRRDRPRAARAHEPGERPGRRRAAVRCALGLLVLTLCLVRPEAAAAHTELVASTPNAGDTVPLSSPRLVLLFNEALAQGGVQVVVTDETGNDVTRAEPVISGDTVEVSLELGRAGRHEVAYRVTGGDGHPIVGEFAFDVAPATAPASATTPADLEGPPVTDAGSESGTGWAPASTLPWLVALLAVVALTVLVRRAGQGAGLDPPLAVPLRSRRRRTPNP